MASYIPLRNHSSYSLLEGALSIDRLLSLAQQHNLSAIGLADTGHLFGAMEFSLKCAEKKIQPILGSQLSLKEGEHIFPFCAYAKNAAGYKSLCALVTASTVGQPEALRGHLTFHQLSLLTEGMLIIAGYPTGFKKEEEAFVFLDQFSALFPDHLYAEISRHQGSLAHEERWMDWAYQKNIPLIATNQAFFATPEDFEAHDVLHCVAMGRYVQEADRPRYTPQHNLRSPSEMETLFEDVPEALKNTLYFAQRCSFLLRARPARLPRFSVETDEKKLLFRQAEEGLQQRLSEEVFPLHPEDQKTSLSETYEKRLRYELDMIIQMDFAGYFLIVADFIQWAKNKKIPVGPGRGSGAGSLVAWCLRITDVDPLRFHLFFERFLNPERVSLPDFDVDFCQERRDEVIAYVAQKYGSQHVAHIVTFGSLQARAVLRDVGRALQMPYSQVDRICKVIPALPPMDLTEALSKEPLLTTWAEEDETVAKLLQIGQKLEGLYRHASVHAAGVVISAEPLIETTALYQDADSALPATEFSMKYVEAAGLIKFDFLGLKNLTVLHHTQEMLAARGIVVDLLKIPLDDPKTFALLRRVETVGIFQLESRGMSDVLRQLQPESFEELIALVALYRPGPMDDIPRYIACRHQREQVTYPYPCLEGILKETFGVMVYQEQVLQIAQVLAGYTLGRADLLRRAMGKKIAEEMRAQRELFIQGVVDTHGGDREPAVQLFDQIAKFASYAFPKAHATPYALIAYQTAYMKAHYPVEFMAALMTQDMMNSDKLRGISHEVRQLGLSLFPPDINASFPVFSPEESPEGAWGIRYGLCAIKNVGTAIMETLCEERSKGGLFRDIFDVMKRVPGLNKKHLEGLIAAGALDCLHPERHTLMASVEIILNTPKVEENQLFSLAPPSLKSVPAWPIAELLQKECEALGFYFSGHPLESCWPQQAVSYAEVLTQENLGTVAMAGVVMDVKQRTTKTGKRFAIVFLSDPSGEYEVACFSEALQTILPVLQIGQPLSLSVEAKRTGDSLRLSLQQASALQHQDDSIVYEVSSQQQLQHIQALLSKAPLGRTVVRLQLRVQDSVVTLRLPKTYEVPLSLRSGL